VLFLQLVTSDILSCKHNAYVVVHISIARGAEPNMPSHDTRSLPRALLPFGLVLRTVDIPEKLDGLRMELEDGAYPALASVTVCVSELEKAFKGCDVFVATGGFPRQKGMERKDLIAKNAPIFAEQGAAIEEFASKDIKVCVCVCACVCARAGGGGTTCTPPISIASCTRLATGEAPITPEHSLATCCGF
jgi:hypothetical protein